jgi:hypothetical protein
MEDNRRDISSSRLQIGYWAISAEDGGEGKLGDVIALCLRHGRALMQWDKPDTNAMGLSQWVDQYELYGVEDLHDYARVCHNDTHVTNCYEGKRTRSGRRYSEY